MSNERYDVGDMVTVELGCRRLVSFEEDPGWHHERVILGVAGDEEWVVLTTGEDSYSEYIDGYSRKIFRVGRVVEFKFPTSGRDMVGHITDGFQEARRLVQDRRRPRPGVSRDFCQLER